MKKWFLAVLISSVFLCTVFGQNRGPIDLILVLDTSSSMSDYNEQVSDYLIGPFLREFLRMGDTFHLISFAEEPRLELSRRITERGDVETIIARLLLMYPLIRHTDIISAVDFAEAYAGGLPSGRAKKVIVITDGKNNAIPGSKNANVNDDEIARFLSSGAASRFTRMGADFYYVKVPLTGDVPGGMPPARTSPATQPAGPSAGTSPGTSTQQPSGPVTPGTSATTEPSRTPPTQQAQPGTSSGSSQTTVPPSTVPQDWPSPTGQTPDSTPLSQGTSPDGSGSADGITTGPDQTIPSDGTGGSGTSTVPPASTGIQDNDTPPMQTTTPDRSSAGQDSGSSISAFFSNIPLPMIILLILIAALIIGLIIFFMTRNLHRTPGKAVYEASNYNAKVLQDVPPDETANKNAELLATFAARQRRGSGTQSPYGHGGRHSGNIPVNGPLMLSLFVEDQNTAIGRRNIHTVKSGHVFSVGGGKSDFLIFLVPIPPHIAEVRFDGKNCTFIPRKPKYFPDIGSQQVPNCIGKVIRVVSDKNYELFVRIERYHDPLLELNRLLNSISLPGPPDDKAGKDQE